MSGFRINYNRSAFRERWIKDKFEKEGWLSFRMAGSHGIADVVAIRPTPNCSYPNHYEVALIQIKVSQNFKTQKIITEVEESPCGNVNVDYYQFPVHTKKWSEANKKRKEKEKIKAKKIKAQLKKKNKQEKKK